MCVIIMYLNLGGLPRTWADTYEYQVEGYVPRQIPAVPLPFRQNKKTVDDHNTNSKTNSINFIFTEAPLVECKK